MKLYEYWIIFKVIVTIFRRVNDFRTDEYFNYPKVFWSRWYRNIFLTLLWLLPLLYYLHSYRQDVLIFFKSIPSYKIVVAESQSLWNWNLTELFYFSVRYWQRYIMERPCRSQFHHSNGLFVGHDLNPGVPQLPSHTG